MIVEFDKSFEKSLDHLKNPIILKRLENVIIQIEKASSLTQVSNIKKLSGFSDYYRIRIGEFRVGSEALNKKFIHTGVDCPGALPFFHLLQGPVPVSGG